MADDKKPSGGGGMSIGGIFFWGILILFVMWLSTGGPSRTENKYNPFLVPYTEDPEFPVYGEGGIFQEGVEDLITDGVYTGWKIHKKVSFSFLTPPKWTSQDGNDFDGTEFGEITNGDITLLYQYGKGANQLNLENNINYEVVYGKVNKRKAKFVRPLTSNADITGANIKKNKRKQITVYTNQDLTPEQEKEVFQIINTIYI